MEKTTDLGKIRDSKRLTALQREKFYEIIYTKCWCSISLRNSEEIDHLDILQASLLAMRDAVNSVIMSSGKCPDIVYLDGLYRIPELNYRQKPIVKADNSIPCVSAASIVAKVTRDEIMRGYDEVYPGWNFKKHKGYPTKMHLQTLELFGPTQIHRKTFKPVEKVLRQHDRSLGED